MLPVKRRTAEKRREISRCAARHRREKEADVFTDLYVTVPIVEEPKVTHVDRIAVLRLAASLCRFRQVADKVLNGKLDTENETGIPSGLFNETVLGESLNGFLLVVDSRSSIIYISPNVSRSLGLTQTDLIGHSFHDFLHQDDIAELKTTFAKTEVGCVETLVVRMKSVLGARGRNLNLRSALYKAVSFGLVKHQIDNVGNGAIARNALKEFPQQQADGNDDNVDEDDDISSSPSPDIRGPDSNHYYFLYGSLINQYGNLESHSAGAFVTRHSMDMKFSYCHDRLSDYLGYDIKSLMGISFYSLVHPEDLKQICSELKELYKKGQLGTSMYRLMAKSGGCIWLTSEISVVTQGTRSGRGQHVVCVHQVISEVEKGEILADVQQNMPISVNAYSKFTLETTVKKTTPTPAMMTTRANDITATVTLSERAPNVTNSGGATIPVLAYAGNYDRWLFRGCRSTTDTEYASPLVSIDECRSALHSNYSSSGSRGEDVDSPDGRSPPLLVGVGNDVSSAYYSQYNAFEFDKVGNERCGSITGSDASSERAPMLIPADSVGTNGSQPGQNRNMYPALLDADFSSTKDLSDQLDDLSLLAPFVDTAELVHLDLIDEDLEVPLDFGDFNDISLDFFTEDKRAKPLSVVVQPEKLATKQEYDPTIASCHADLHNISPKSLGDIHHTYSQGVKDSDWPQIIENLSPMTSGRTETVHESYHVTIERSNNATNWSNNSNGFLHQQQFDKTAINPIGFKREHSNYCCKKMNENFNAINDDPYKIANKLDHHQNASFTNQESTYYNNQHPNFGGQQHQTYGYVGSKPVKPPPEYSGGHCYSKLTNYDIGGLLMKSTTPLQHLSTMVTPPNYHSFHNEPAAPRGGQTVLTIGSADSKKSKRHQHSGRHKKSSRDSLGNNFIQDRSIGAKRRLPCGDTSSTNQHHVTGHVSGLNFYHNPSLEVAIPPPLYPTAGSATWHQQQLQQRPPTVYYNAPLLFNDQVITGEPKVKRYKMSNLLGYIKVENI